MKEQLVLRYRGLTTYEAWVVEAHNPDSPRFMLSRLTDEDFRAWPWRPNELLRFWWETCLKQVAA